MKEAKIQQGLREVRRPDLLKRVIETSKRHFGFFTDRYPRVFEYTWILENLKGRTGKALDIGAGVCPLPLILAEDGWQVTTIDSLPKDKVEWGFKDYATINKNITSVNVDFAEYKDRKRYEVIYSVSVIEHMRASSRRNVFKNAYKLLKKEAVILLTIDLIKQTQSLWNKNRGVPIEDNHGTINDVVRELESVGFVNVSFNVQNGINGVATDLLYVIASK